MPAPTFIAPADMVRAIGPVTRTELDQLRANRDKPGATLELTPGGAVERIVKNFEHERRTVREAYISNRLERIQQTAGNDFSLAKRHGRARRAFERSR